MTALDEVKPAFGLDSSGMLENKVKGGIFDYGPSFTHLMKSLTDMMDEFRSSTNM